MMNENFYSVQQVASMLSMHPKTIQRYIREGKINAKKYGKSWRISGHDLSLFTEKNSLMKYSDINENFQSIVTSSVVDIPINEKSQSLRIMNLLTAVMNSKPRELSNATMHSMYIEQENKLRITLWGNIEFMKEMMEIIFTITSSDN